MEETRLYSRTEGTQRLADALEKPLLDNRSYRVIRLPNQLEALLIHDPDTDKASAAMDVDVGSLADPPDMQGMAHAVEHVLFLGTEKYPGENEYNSYLTKYAGYSNAFTAPTSTNYYFELSATATSNSAASSMNNSQSSLPISKSKTPLYGALDRFAQFFVKPLFNADALDRELRAVDSENKKNLQSDNWRSMQLEKACSSKAHPYHLFATGNYKLLHDDPIARGVNIREEFIKFYQKHYSANRMRLVVLGLESLDEMQAWVEELFANVQNKNLPKLRWDGIPAQTAEELCTQIFVKPVMDTRSLAINFPYPDEEDLFDSRPSHYISHLIGHEGPGSILTYLNKKGWVSALSAGANRVCPGTSFFSVSLRLTTEGLKNYQQVIKAVFQYIAMLKEHPPQEWIVEEQKKLAEIDFRFQQKIPASRTTSSLSGVMQQPIPRDRLLSGQSLIRTFNPEGIQRGLAALRTDNFRFTVNSQEFPGDWDRKEEWYGTDYKFEKIPREFMQELEETQRAPADQRPAELHLPTKNEFIPQRLDVEKKEPATPALWPKLVRNDSNVRAWFKKDDRFWVPKANINLFLRTPLHNASPFTFVVMQLFKDLVEDSLIEYSYDAELAGLNYNLSGHANAIEVALGGYNDKMHVLLEKVLLSMRDLEVKQDRFDIMKERLLRGYRNAEFIEPYRQLSSYNRWLSKNRSWANHELLEALPAVTAEDVRKLYPQMLRQMHIELLAHGNLYKEDVLRITDRIDAILKPQPLPRSQWDTSRTLDFPPGCDYRYEHKLANPENINHCIDYTLYLGDAQDRPLRAKLLLIAHILQEPCFDTLRTKEQLGYIVSSGPVLNGNQAGFRILIQSEKDCPYLEKRIDAFLIAVESTMKDMSQDEFDEHRIGVINQRLEKLKNLNQESTRFWHHITSEMFDFESVNRDVEELEVTTKEDVLEFFTTFFKPGAPARAKLSMHLIAQASADDIAAKTSPAEKTDKLVGQLSDLFGQMGLQIDNAVLSKQLQKVDVAAGNVQDIMSSVGGYLKDAAGLAEEQVQQVVQQGQTILPPLLAAAGIKAPTEEIAAKDESANGVADDSSKSKTVVIKDVQAFKANMGLKPGPRAIRDPAEFEDLEPKL